ncbi:MAG TPA: DUF2147 domain-containing protein [Caulobacteraceae bacterium]|jgi:uncharacterized protein (DUF2147 family)|nr:DUF2147 domain-containing protein [Caulobacteraceae bacterium]
MRRPLLFCTLAAALIGAVASAKPAVRQPVASPIAGLWKLPDDNVVVRIAPCGRSLCGTLVSADKLKANPHLKDKMNKNAALRGRPLKGLPLLTGFTGGPSKWKDGKVYNPDDGRTYKSELTLTDPDTLDLKGCVVKPLCKSKTLTRVR